MCQTRWGELSRRVRFSYCVSCSQYLFFSGTVFVTLFFTTVDTLNPRCHNAHPTGLTFFGHSSVGYRYLSPFPVPNQVLGLAVDFKQNVLFFFSLSLGFRPRKGDAETLVLEPCFVSDIPTSGNPRELGLLTYGNCLVPTGSNSWRAGQ